MKKTGFFIALCFVLTSATASSIVTLSGGGDVSPGTSLSISLNGVVPSVNYNVVCYIDTIYPFQYVLLGSNFSENISTIISYSLNGNYIVQDQLIAGHNIAVINGKFYNPSTGYVVFTNLDQTNPFNVNNCFAIPVQA